MFILCLFSIASQRVFVNNSVSKADALSVIFPSDPSFPTGAVDMSFVSLNVNIYNS